MPHSLPQPTRSRPLERIVRHAIQCALAATTETSPSGAPSTRNTRRRPHKHFSTVFGTSGTQRHESSTWLPVTPTLGLLACILQGARPSTDTTRTWPSLETSWTVADLIDHTSAQDSVSCNDTRGESAPMAAQAANTGSDNATSLRCMPNA